MKQIQIAIVPGAEGASLQVRGKTGGLRIDGPKAWGNAYNHPQHLFTVNADELVAAIRKHAFSPEADKTRKRKAQP